MTWSWGKSFDRASLKMAWLLFVDEVPAFFR